LLLVSREGLQAQIICSTSEGVAHLIHHEKIRGSREHELPALLWPLFVDSDLDCEHKGGIALNLVDYHFGLAAQEGSAIGLHPQQSGGVIKGKIGPSSELGMAFDQSALTRLPGAGDDHNPHGAQCGIEKRRYRAGHHRIMSIIYRPHDDNLHDAWRLSTESMSSL
jgi:hypothetical protein